MTPSETSLSDALRLARSIDTLLMAAANLSIDRRQASEEVWDLVTEAKHHAGSLLTCLEAEDSARLIEREASNG